MSKPKGKSTKAFSQAANSLKSIFFFPEDHKKDVLTTDFNVLGVKVTYEEDGIVESIQTAPKMKVGLIVKDMKNKTDSTSYFLGVRNPIEFFGISKREMPNAKQAIISKAKLLKTQTNDFI